MIGPNHFLDRLRWLYRLRQRRLPRISSRICLWWRRLWLLWRHAAHTICIMTLIAQVILFQSSTERADAPSRNLLIQVGAGSAALLLWLRIELVRLKAATTSFNINNSLCASSGTAPLQKGNRCPLSGRKAQGFSWQIPWWRPDRDSAGRPHFKARFPVRSFISASSLRVMSASFSQHR